MVVESDLSITFRHTHTHALYESMLGKTVYRERVGERSCGRAKSHSTNSSHAHDSRTRQDAYACFLFEYENRKGSPAEYNPERNGAALARH